MLRNVQIGWLGPRAGLDAVKNRKSCPCWGSNSGRPVHSLVTILTELSWFLLSAYIILNMFKSLQEK